MKKLSEHFSEQEFTCKCGCGFARVSSKLIESLEELRLLVRQPILINSACRCADHNKRVGGSPNSQHIRGTAADIRVTGMSAESLARAAEQVRGFRVGGIGIYTRQGFVHVDVRGFKSRWTL